MLGALLKRVLSEMEAVIKEIVQACEDQRVVGERKPQLADMIKMFLIPSPKKCTFICIDGLDEYVLGNRVKVLHSIDLILPNSP